MLYWLMCSIVQFAVWAPEPSPKITVQYSTPDNLSGEYVIAYQKKHRLQLGSFLQTPPEDHPALAITTSGFSFNAYARKLNETTEIQIRISCLFYPNRSWIKPNGLNQATLNHEQRHFDLSYIACNRFYQAVSKQEMTMADFKIRLNELYQVHQAWLTGMQERYDGETSNGLNHSEQVRWNQQIDSMLKQINSLGASASRN